MGIQYVTYTFFIIESETPKSPISVMVSFIVWKINIEDSLDDSNPVDVNPFASEKQPKSTEQSESADAENPFAIASEVNTFKKHH